MFKGFDVDGTSQTKRARAFATHFTEVPLRPRSNKHKQPTPLDMVYNIPFAAGVSLDQRSVCALLLQQKFSGFP